MLAKFSLAFLYMVLRKSSGVKSFPIGYPRLLSQLPGVTTHGLTFFLSLSSQVVPGRDVGSMFFREPIGRSSLFDRFSFMLDAV